MPIPLGFAALLVAVTALVGAVIGARRPGVGESRTRSAVLSALVVALGAAVTIALAFAADAVIGES